MHTKSIQLVNCSTSCVNIDFYTSLFQIRIPALDGGGSRGTVLETDPPSPPLSPTEGGGLVWSHLLE